LLEAYAVADLAAHRAAAFTGDEGGGGPRRDAAWLEHDDLLGAAEPASSNAAGTRVVFPAPGGARSTKRAPRDRQATTSGRSGSIGRGCTATRRNSKSQAPSSQ